MPLKFPREEYIQRCDKLRGLMEKHHLHGVVLTNHQNVNYFAGITSILAGNSRRVWYGQAADRRRSPSR